MYDSERKRQYRAANPSITLTMRRHEYDELVAAAREVGLPLAVYVRDLVRYMHLRGITHATSSDRPG